MIVDSSMRRGRQAEGGELYVTIYCARRPYFKHQVRGYCVDGSLIIPRSAGVSYFGHVMKNLNPRHINETESDRRGVKGGWYAINGVGKLGSGPFENREDCLSAIDQQSAAIDASIH